MFVAKRAGVTVGRFYFFADKQYLLHFVLNPNQYWLFDMIELIAAVTIKIFCLYFPWAIILFSG